MIAGLDDFVKYVIFGQGLTLIMYLGILQQTRRLETMHSCYENSTKMKIQHIILYAFFQFFDGGSMLKYLRN